MSTVFMWRGSRCAGRIEASSGRQVPAGFTGAHYLIDADCGFRPAAPSVDATWQVKFVLEDRDGDAAVVDLGRHRDLDAAEAAAERFEHVGEMPAAPDPFTAHQLALVAEAIAAAWTGSETAMRAAARAALTALAQAGQLRP